MTYANDDFSVEAEQYRYENGQRVCNRRKVVRKFDRERCIILHTIYGDTHAETKNGICTSCGAVESDYANHPVKVEKFEQILDLEDEVRGAKVSIMFAPTGLSDYQHANRRKALENARRALSEAVDALTPQEGKAFGQYRVRNH